MLIGIDASALVKKQPTGVEFYVHQLLAAMMQEPLPEGDCVVLYAPLPKPADLALPTGWTWKELRYWLPKGWTHARLSIELFLYPPDVFFSPAHEIPLLHRKAKIVSTVHDIVFRHAPRSYAPRSLRRQEWAIRRAAKLSSALLAVSQATKQDLLDMYKVPEERVTVTPLALRPLPQVAATDEVLRHYVLPAKDFLLFVGRIEEKKGIETLLEAYLGVRKRLPKGRAPLLVFAGKRGYGGKELEAKAVASSLARDIRFLGYVPEAHLPALYRSALAFVFPSNGEGFGLPLLEAMSAGTPVVASDIPALREVAGGAALLATPRDIPSWTAALERIILEPELRASLQSAGEVRLRNFSWSSTAQTTWEVLRKLCTPT